MSLPAFLILALVASEGPPWHPFHRGNFRLWHGQSIQMVRCGKPTTRRSNRNLGLFRALAPVALERSRPVAQIDKCR